MTSAEHTGSAPENPSRTWIMPLVAVHLQPDEVHLTFHRHKVKTIGQLLVAMNIRPCTALVARGNELLTPDRPTLPGDALLVRKVTSSG